VRAGLFRCVQTHAQFGGMHFVMDSIYHISQGIYDERREKEWPDPIPGTFLASVDEPTHDQPTASATVVSDGGLMPVEIEDDFLETLILPLTAPPKRSDQRRNKKKRRGTPPDLPPLGDLFE